MRFNRPVGMGGLHRLGAFAAALTLTACSTLPEPPVRPAVYDFGPGMLVLPATNRMALLPPITLGEVDAPLSLDSTAVLYRLTYADAQQLRPYALARWSMPPAQLVRQRLRESLGQRRSVLNSGEGGAVVPAQLLRVELEEFSQLFESAGKSVGLVRWRASLWDQKGGSEQLRAQRSFVVQRPASSADAAGGVRALTAATDAAVDELAQWLAQVQ
ncbi:ABC-type transport auxiliary lipoprotein family protein [Limnohabitans sp.]|uniref:ABC-type transport auxiliary lipoprotein family protein n=1 Tax=Limnohabitans sp. TaxID=1907725 RepID=UPI0038BD4BAD